MHMRATRRKGEGSGPTYIRYLPTYMSWTCSLQLSSRLRPAYFRQGGDCVFRRITKVGNARLDVLTNISHSRDYVSLRILSCANTVGGPQRRAICQIPLPICPTFPYPEQFARGWARAGEAQDSHLGRPPSNERVWLVCTRRFDPEI
jgi:hypothetical protein